MIIIFFNLVYFKGLNSWCRFFLIILLFLVVILCKLLVGDVMLGIIVKGIFIKLVSSLRL